MTDWNHRALAHLTDDLAKLYPNESDARLVAAKVRLRQAHIDFAGSSVTR